MFGWREEEVIGNPLPTWPEHIAGESRSILQRVLGGERLTEVETHRKRKDGTVIDVLITAAPVRGSAGQVVGALGILTDITDRKKAAHEKELLRNQLYQAQKMEAVGQLAGGIAHDFNNILTAIVGSAFIASRQMDSDDPRKVYIDHIGTSAERAANLTQNL
jgi:PAS domain S-box-containing protein